LLKILSVTVTLIEALNLIKGVKRKLIFS